MKKSKRVTRKILSLFLVLGLCLSISLEIIYAAVSSEETIEQTQANPEVNENEVLGEPIEANVKKGEAIEAIVKKDEPENKMMERSNTRTIVGDVATIDMGMGIVRIDETGFTQNNSAKTEHRGSYVLTGNYSYDTFKLNTDIVVIVGGSEKEPIKVTLDNVTLSNNNPDNGLSAGSAIRIGGSTKGVVETGHVAMILKGNNVLIGAKLMAGIELYGTNADNSRSTLSIDGDGKLTTTGGESGAGIGSTMQPIKEVYYRLTINSGTIIAQGGKHAAGIGGGKNSSGGEIIINGGNVTSTGGINGAGIGGGTQQTQVGLYGLLTDMSVKINGGNVQATGGDFAPGIGTGVIQFIWNDILDNLPIKKLDISITNGAVVNATGGKYASGIGHGWNSHFYYDKAPAGTKLPENPWEISNLLIENADVTAKGKEYSAGIGTSKTGVIHNLKIQNSKVYAVGGYAGPGIGSGYDKFSHVNNIVISGAGDVTAIGGVYAAGIGTGMKSNVGAIKILGGNVKALSSVLPDVNGDLEGNAAGIGTGYDGRKVDTIFIGKDATVEATAGLFSSGIGRGLYVNVVVDAFPITIEAGANITAYAMGDFYATQFKENPDDENESTPDIQYITAIDQECMAHPDSKFEANMLMGDFKEIPNENKEQKVTINSVQARVNNKVTLPAGYASFATTVSDGLNRVVMNGATYAGNDEKSKEDNLIINMGGKSSELYDYWMLQPKTVEYKVDFQFGPTENPDGITVPNAITVEENMTIAIPEFTAPNNWTFNGWYLDKECTLKFDFNTPIMSDMMLYGNWVYKSPENPQPEEPTNPSNPANPTTPPSISESETDLPKTGDATNLNIFITLLGISASLFLLLVGKRKKQRDS